jgi:ABC-type branched-subunit amino acid transport system substrate-binding protein
LVFDFLLELLMAAERSSSDARRAPSLSVLAACLMAAGVAACATGGVVPPAAPPPPTAPPPAAPATAPAQSHGGLTPAFMVGQPIVRIGVLLPFSTPRSEAGALYDAAEMAMFDHGDPSTLLIPRDSGADPNAAGAAARQLIADGADVIVGPVAQDQITGIAGATRAAHVPVIAFSTDRSVAGQGIYLLTYPFEEEVARIVDYATSKGIKRFAILAPDTEYGRRVDAAFRQEVSRRAASVVLGRYYTRTDQDAATAATMMASQLKAAGAQALLIPENGSPLRAIGQAFAQASFDKQAVKLLGTSLWASDAPRDPNFAGGWYAAPDPALRAAFEARFQAVYGRAPSRLAALAYDAVAVSETLARDVGRPGLSPQALQRQDGFLGADGVFRFRPDGTVQRGLAVLEVHAGQSDVVDPAPKALTNRGF